MGRIFISVHFRLSGKEHSIMVKVGLYKEDDGTFQIEIISDTFEEELVAAYTELVERELIKFVGIEPDVNKETSDGLVLTFLC